MLESGFEEDVSLNPGFELGSAGCVWMLTMEEWRAAPGSWSATSFPCMFAWLGVQVKGFTVVVCEGLKFSVNRGDQVEVF